MNSCRRGQYIIIGSHNDPVIHHCTSGNITVSVLGPDPCSDYQKQEVEACKAYSQPGAAATVQKVVTEADTALHLVRCLKTMFATPVLVAL